jgi:hypothetical protein
MTAVEWFVEQLPIRIVNMYHKEIEQTKEMEKDQIMDAYIDRMDCTDKEEMRKIMGGQYYNETYKK